jgi:hypothetical protein
MSSGLYRHDIGICPDTKTNGERGWWTASVARKGESVSYDGTGRTIEEALVDLIDNMADDLLASQPPTETVFTHTTEDGRTYNTRPITDSQGCLNCDYFLSGEDEECICRTNCGHPDCKAS